MTDSLDRSFKYAMMDTNRVYIGGRMTYSEMITWEEVPFKIKAIVNNHLLKDAGNPDLTMAEHFKNLPDDSFVLQILKTLKTRIKVDIPQAKGKNPTKDNVTYKSSLLKIEEYLRFVRNHEGYLTLPDGTEVEPVTEEISFSKLAVLVFSA
jgi:hypothetical protein